jgi:DNA-binding transcriptional regulator/RsmH inhibitor MraZ
MTGHEPPEDVDRRTMLLDEMSEVEIDEMARSEIPPEHRYSVSEIAD